VSANQIWAVGYAEDFASLKSTTLIERWNGSTWSIVPSPNPAGSNRPNELFALAASGSNVVWAVGEAGYPEEEALILRLNGNRWRAVPNGCGTALYGLDVVSANDVWAVGPNTTCHFDGSAWVVVPSPQPRGQYNEVEYSLRDVSALGPNDVWASGYRVIDFGEYVVYASIVEHWDGKAWSLTTIVPGHQLNGIEAIAAADVWAVGTDATRGVVAHFDGQGWNLVPSPSPGDTGMLADVEAESSDHLWAVGTSLRIASSWRRHHGSRARSSDRPVWRSPPCRGSAPSRVRCRPIRGARSPRPAWAPEPTSSSRRTPAAPPPRPTSPWSREGP
jgi:hypothetical protein